MMRKYPKLKYAERNDVVISRIVAVIPLNQREEVVTT